MLPAEVRDRRPPDDMSYFSGGCMPFGVSKIVTSGYAGGPKEVR
jgi:hypothetical protein